MFKREKGVLLFCLVVFIVIILSNYIEIAYLTFYSRRNYNFDFIGIAIVELLFYMPFVLLMRCFVNEKRIIYLYPCISFITGYLIYHSNYQLKALELGDLFVILYFDESPLTFRIFNILLKVFKSDSLYFLNLHASNSIFQFITLFTSKRICHVLRRKYPMLGSDESFVTGIVPLQKAKSKLRQIGMFITHEK